MSNALHYLQTAKGLFWLVLIVLVGVIVMVIRTFVDIYRPQPRDVLDRVTVIEVRVANIEQSLKDAKLDEVTPFDVFQELQTVRELLEEKPPPR